MPDQFKYMFEARSKHSSTQTSYRSSKTPEKEHCVLDLDDDEAFPPLLAKQTGIIFNKMLSSVPCVGSFSGSILGWDHAMLSEVVA